jgi:hypothetical protein
MFLVLCEETGASSVEYSVEGRRTKSIFVCKISVLQEGNNGFYLQTNNAVATVYMKKKVEVTARSQWNQNHSIALSVSPTMVTQLLVAACFI